MYDIVLPALRDCVRRHKGHSPTGDLWPIPLTPYRESSYINSAQTEGNPQLKHKDEAYMRDGTRQSLLAVFPCAPWPVRFNGISIRYYPVLAHLSATHDIDLQTTGDYREAAPDDPLHEKLRSFEVRKFSAEPQPPKWRRVLTRLRMLSPFGQASRDSTYQTRRVYEALAVKLRENRYDTVLWTTTSHTAALCKLMDTFPDTRFVLDLIDSAYLHYCRDYTNPSWLRRFDLWKAKRWEAKLVRSRARVAFIAEEDARAASNYPSIVIPNGLAVDDYRPPVGPPEFSLGFLGNMAYRPNIAAALRLYHDIYLPLRADFPGLKLRIIGRDPAPCLQALAGPGVTLTGSVDNIWTEIHKCAVMVFPMTSGAGLQNKVLEAMYAGKAVATTEICRASVGATHHCELMSASSMEDLRQHVGRLLIETELRDRIGQAAHAYVTKKYHLPSVLREFENLLFPRTSGL